MVIIKFIMVDINVLLIFLVIFEVLVVVVLFKFMEEKECISFKIVFSKFRRGEMVIMV